MRYQTLTLTASALLLAFSTAVQADNARAKLDPFNENPAVIAFGQGQLKAKLAGDDGIIRYQLSYSGVDSPVLQAHIHLGKAWENGGVVAFLCTNLGNAPPDDVDVPACPETAGVAEGIIDTDDIIGDLAGDMGLLLDAIEVGAVYVNVHTVANPPGHMRGQLHD